MSKVTTLLIKVRIEDDGSSPRTDEASLNYALHVAVSRLTDIAFPVEIASRTKTIDTDG